ncbi:hypothetical protein [Paludibaculum fermentans]|uniref:hypothetical protein n=1 Tax=Paludibaculum fermentans TaxID=1473598 RepID=UPI003EBCBCA1
MLDLILLLTTSGMWPFVFFTVDPLRLPVGLLTDMEFVGGAIVRRDCTMGGATTAAASRYATFWGLVPALHNSRRDWPCLDLAWRFSALSGALSP